MLMQSSKSFTRSKSFSFPLKFKNFFATGIYQLKLNNKNSRAKCAICLNINKKKYRKDVKCSHSNVIFVNFEHLKSFWRFNVDFEQLNASWVH